MGVTATNNTRDRSLAFGAKSEGLGIAGSQDEKTMVPERPRNLSMTNDNHLLDPIVLVIDLGGDGETSSGYTYPGIASTGVLCFQSLLPALQRPSPRIFLHKGGKRTPSNVSLQQKKNISILGIQVHATGWSGFRFMHKHGDADLSALLTLTVPPADLDKVSMFSAHLEKFHQEAVFGNSFDMFRPILDTFPLTPTPPTQSCLHRKAMAK